MVYEILAYLFGTIIGSFLNVVIWRLPREESLSGRSHCPSCGHVLGIFDLFPVFSFVFLKRRCRYCRAKISFRYPFVEVLTGLLFVLAWAAFAPQDIAGYFLLAKSLIIIATFIVVFAVDWEHFLILDNVILPAGVAIFLLNAAVDLSAGRIIYHPASHFLSGIIGAAAGALPLFLLWLGSSGRWMGFGDVKFALLLGIAFGWPLVYVNLMLAIFLGGITAVLLLARGKKTLKSQVPFGTFLSVAGIIVLFWGEFILHWYLSLLGY